MPSIRLTQAAVLNLKTKRNREDFYDTICRPLIVTVQATGTKSFAMKFRNPHGVRQTLTLGPVDFSGRESTDVPVIGEPLNLMRARMLCASVNADRARGIDVIARYKQIKLEAVQGRVHVFGGAALNYTEQYLKRNVKRWQAAARLIGIAPDSEGELAITPKGLADRWRDKPLSSITADDVHWIIDEARERAVPGLTRKGDGPSESMAHQMSSKLRSMFTWLLEKRLIKTNVFADVVSPKNPAKARERVLSDSEIVRFWKACDKLEAPAGQCLRLLLLTGARLNEIAMLARAEVDGNVITIPSARSKNKLPHMIPLPPLALEILQSVNTPGDLYFVGKRGRPLGPWSRIKAALDQHMNPDSGFVIHDLRRTVSTGMNGLGIAPATVESVLNHISGHKAGVAGTYNRHHYADEKRAAFARWADHVCGLVEGRAAKVIPLKTA
jgi:integrase